METIDTKIGGVIFVAGWFDLENLEGPDAEAIAKPWIKTPINTEKVRSSIGFSVTFLGSNDPWVPYEKTKEKFEKLLGSEIITIHDGGHITSDDGFGPFARLVAIAHEKISGIELLEVINDKDEVIGLESRNKIHQEGLLHREIHIWFMTPDGMMIFQHRAKDKDTYPDMLDATVGGHVDPGMSYESTALKEMEEETGIKADLNDLHFLKKMRSRSVDKVTGKINNTIRVQYAYLFIGDPSELKIEKGKSIGFEEWSAEKLLTLSEEEKKKFIPLIYSEEFLDLFKEVQKIIN
jgi:isopentenyldiphosphate isomerase